MDFTTALTNINWPSVVVAALSGFVLGFIWYSPILFGRVWRAEVGLSRDPDDKPNMPLIFGLSFVLNGLAAIVLEMMIGPEKDAKGGFLFGLMAGLFFVATSFGVSYLFARRSVKLFFIDAGYFIFFFPLMGLILGIW